MSCITSNEQCKSDKCCKMLKCISKVLVIFVLIALSFSSWKLCNRITKLESQIGNTAQVQSTQTNAELQK